ncbi:MAG TPA: YifB family Mg chelatase-like AAA ATPase [Solirubrobacteraceae bacterium]|nr:YifB family Mg chelatase-like AAA ATPase [Solirubrobacteraceae bacterium]
MLARAHAFTIDGFQTNHVTVEVDIRPGLPAFVIVGLADTAVREARERIASAIRNSGYEFPARRITANLAPADVPKAGPGLDLPLACAVLAASGQLPGDRLAKVALAGELGLDGSLRPTRGTLAIAEAARAAGLGTLALAAERSREAQLVGGLEVAAVRSLRSAVRVLRGGHADALPAADRHLDRGPQPVAATAPDLSDVRGQRLAVRALVIAAAGAHNLLLSGAPGTGKTMLAQRLPSVLPPLDHAEAVEVTRIRSLLGGEVRGLVRARPFRAPHHTITAAGLIGGARQGAPGEVVLAHNGVLFLDELSEFSRPVLESLRQPLEDGRVAIARANHSAMYPARFMLVAATNPCPCGFSGEVERCRCSEADLARHRRRLSGPLLDRLDLLVNLRRHGDEGEPRGRVISSEQARELVACARERQARNLHEHGVSQNGHMDARTLRACARLDTRAAGMLHRAREVGLLSARGEHRSVRVARTIADLDGSTRIGTAHMAEALAFRPDLAYEPAVPPHAGVPA